jgi:thiamine-monophosphate kinase
VALGIALRGLAGAAIDVSDGLVADLGHLMERSGVGARVQVPDVPSSQALRTVDATVLRRCVLAGGDDYELLFTAAPGDRSAVAAAASGCCTAITRIGTMTHEPGLRLAGDPGIDATLSGFDHFAGTREA